MIYLLITIIVLVAALMLVRLRLRLEIADGRKLLFVGLGRTGPEFDFRTKRGVMKLFGFRTREFVLARGKKSVRDRIKEAVQGEKSDAVAGKKPKAKRTRSVREIAGVVRPSLGALASYLLGLMKAAIVEQAEGEIEAGFEEPNLTGQLFGYYQAALGAAPALVGRVNYIPVWGGAAFSGTVRCSVAWPIYRLVGLTSRLVFRLPVRKIVKLAIGTKEGVQDGE